MPDEAAETAEMERSPTTGETDPSPPILAAGGRVPHHTAPWILQRRLGEAAFGELWLAVHDESGERRIFRFCTDDAELPRMQRQLMMARLFKEAIRYRDVVARTLDGNLERSPYFLESEYIEGGPLPEWIEAQGGMEVISLAWRLELVAQVADSLAAVHSLGVVLGNVEPANLLVSERADRPPRVLLAEFSQGRIIDVKLGAASRHLPAGHAEGGGTSMYRAPELAAGGWATPQSDIFSIGVILYQMIVGDLRRPLGAFWFQDIEDPQLRRDLERFVDPSPSRRPKSAGEMAMRLRTLEQRRDDREREKQERHQRLVRRRTRENLRRRLWQLAATVSGLAVAVGLAALLLDLRAAGAETQRWRQQTTTLVRYLLDELHPQVELSGRLDVLEGLAEQALESLPEAASAELSADERLLRARALGTLGEVRFAQGDRAAARQALEGSLGLLETSTASASRLIEQRRALLFGHFQLAGVLAAEGEAAGALEHYRAHQRVAEHLLESDPENLELRLELARSHAGAGALLELAGDIEGALSEHRASLALKQRLAIEAPSSDIDLAATEQKIQALAERP